MRDYFAPHRSPNTFWQTHLKINENFTQLQQQDSRFALLQALCKSVLYIAESVEDAVHLSVALADSLAEPTLLLFYFLTLQLISEQDFFMKLTKEFNSKNRFGKIFGEIIAIYLQKYIPEKASQSRVMYFLSLQSKHLFYPSMLRFLGSEESDKLA